MLKCKRLKTAVLLVLCVSIIFIALSACNKNKSEGNDQSDNSEETSQTTGANDNASEIKNIVVYCTNSPESVWHKEMIPDFEKANPGIEAEVIEVPFDQFDSKLQTMIASETQPDISTHLGWTGFGEFVSKDALLDLSPYIKASGFNAQEIGIPELLMYMWKVNEKQYAIPINNYVSILVYNKDMFDEAELPYPPSDYEDTSWTWDKMIEYAKKLTVIDNNMAKTQYGLLWQWSADGYEQDPQYFGHNVFPFEDILNGITPEVNYFGSEEVMKDIQTLADLTWKLKISPPPSFIEGIGTNPFLAGKVGMIVKGAWTLVGVNDVDFNVGVASIPLGGNSEVRDVIWCNPYWIFSGSKEPEAAFEWIRFMSLPENQELIIEKSGGSPPANINALDKYTSYFDKIDPQDLKNVYNGGVKYGFPGFMHLMAGSNEIHTLISNELNPVLSGKKQAEEVCPQLQDKLNELLAEIASRN